MTSSATKYYHYNDLGSTVLVTNGSGSATNALAYSAWGTKICGGTQKPYNFVGEYGYYSHTSGQVLDELRQLGVRYYDAETGRFGQIDMYKRPDLSGYTYVDKAPTRVIDPTGKWSWTVWPPWKDDKPEEDEDADEQAMKRLAGWYKDRMVDFVCDNTSCPAGIGTGIGIIGAIRDLPEKFQRAIDVCERNADQMCGDVGFDEAANLCIECCDAIMDAAGVQMFGLQGCVIGCRSEGNFGK